MPPNHMEMFVFRRTYFLATLPLNRGYLVRFI